LQYRSRKPAFISTQTKGKKMGYRPGNEAKLLHHPVLHMHSTCMAFVCD